MKLVSDSTHALLYLLLSYNIPIVRFVADSDDESCEEWSGDALGLEECLFCSFLSHSLQNNLDHMRRKHSFFIPDIEYLTDLEGLISYLGWQHTSFAQSSLLDIFSCKQTRRWARSTCVCGATTGARRFAV